MAGLNHSNWRINRLKILSILLHHNYNPFHIFWVQTMTWVSNFAIHIQLTDYKWAGALQQFWSICLDTEMGRNKTQNTSGIYQGQRWSRSRLATMPKLRSNKCCITWIFVKLRESRQCSVQWGDNVWICFGSTLSLVKMLFFFVCNSLSYAKPNFNQG